MAAAQVSRLRPVDRCRRGRWPSKTRARPADTTQLGRSGYFFLALPGLALSGLAVRWLSTLSRPRSRCLPALPSSRSGRVTDRDGWLPADPPASAGSSEPATWDPWGWLRGGLAAGAMPPACPDAIAACPVLVASTTKPAATPRTAPYQRAHQDQDPATTAKGSVHAGLQVDNAPCWRCRHRTTQTCRTTYPPSHPGHRVAPSSVGVSE